MLLTWKLREKYNKGSMDAFYLELEYNADAQLVKMIILAVILRIKVVSVCHLRKICETLPKEITYNYTFQH